MVSRDVAVAGLAGELYAPRAVVSRTTISDDSRHPTRYRFGKYVGHVETLKKR